MAPVPIPRRFLMIGILASATVIAGWAFRDSFVSCQARECARMYRAARTAADTVAVEATVPAGEHQTREPRSCGSFRSAARWFVIR